MSNLMPEGENLRAAVRFIAEEREVRQKAEQKINLVQLVDAACIRFDLTPGDGEFLLRFVRDQGLDGNNG